MSPRNGGAELGIEISDAADGRPWTLTGRGRSGTATCAAAARRGQFENRQQRHAAQAGVVGRSQRADLDLLHLLKALGHDFYI